MRPVLVGFLLAQVPVHLDCVILEPTVEIDGEALVRDGELLV